MTTFIEESKKLIQKASDNNKLVVFVGAGVSANSGYPSWSELVKEFAKGIGKDIEKISGDDYLKIPQYYYNSRGQKEYYDVIYNKFNIKPRNNPIPRLIIDLYPYHIITTNYDDILEKAAYDKGKFYDVVSKDSDLPYTPNNSMIIKMHGELKNKNIVLKEDDYLSYFKNFRLIQNYIKSLISTHTILFIGYSVSDINVKYIFQWVKDILGNDLQRAYFIESDGNKSFDQIEYEYYKNRGINLLYYSEIAEDKIIREIKETDKDLDLIETVKGKHLYKFLKYLIDDKNKLDIDYVYDRLKEVDNLKNIWVSNIVSAIKLNDFKEDEYISLVGEKLFVNGNDFINFFAEIKEYEKYFKEKDKKSRICFPKKEKIDLIKRVLYKTGARQIVKKDNNQDIILMDLNIDLKDDDLLNYILNYEYWRLEEFMDENSNLIEDERYEKYSLDKAYSMYKLDRRKEKEAYYILKKFSEVSKKKHKYFYYFISEFNRYYLGKGIYDSKIKKESTNIDLYDIYLKMSSSNRQKVMFLRDILTFEFVYRNIEEILHMLKQVEKDRDTTYLNISQYEITIYRLMNKVEKFWSFLVENRLMIDNYREVKKVFYMFIESICISYTTINAKRMDRIFEIEVDIKKIGKINYFMIFIILEYLKIQELRFLFRKYEIDKIEINDTDLEKVINIDIEYLCAKSKIKDIEFLEKYFYILSKVNIGKEFFEIVLQKTINILDSHLHYYWMFLYSPLKQFIVMQYVQYSNIECGSLEKFINFLLLKVLTETKDLYVKEKVVEFIKLCSNIIKSTDEKYVLEKNEYINFYMSQILLNNKKYENLILIYMYKILDKDCQNNIYKDILERLNKEDKFDHSAFDIYCQAVINEIILSTDELENKASEYLDENNKNGIGDKLNQIANLMLRGTIRYPNKFEKYTEFDAKFDFLFNMKSFDYRKFDLEWLNLFSPGLHEKIAECEIAKENIKSKLKQKIINNDSDKRTREIFFKYYD